MWRKEDTPCTRPCPQGIVPRRPPGQAETFRLARGVTKGFCYCTSRMPIRAAPDSPSRTALSHTSRALEAWAGTWVPTM